MSKQFSKQTFTAHDDKVQSLMKGTGVTGEKKTTTGTAYIADGDKRKNGSIGVT